MSVHLLVCVRFVRPSHVSCHKSSMMLSNDEESKSPYRTLWTPGPYWRQTDTMRVIMDIIETLQWRHGHKTKCGWNKKLGKTYSDQKPKHIAWTREVGIYKDLHTYIHMYIPQLTQYAHFELRILFTETGYTWTRMLRFGTSCLKYNIKALKPIHKISLLYLASIFFGSISCLFLFIFIFRIGEAILSHY